MRNDVSIENHVNPSLEIKRLHALVNGYVQGVGFRWFVLHHARPLNLNGWVRNLANGDVEVFAEGPKRDLETLLDYLRMGPSHSVVRNVETRWSEPQGMTGGFDISF